MSSAARNGDRFGFGAYPDVHGSTGNRIFIVNEKGLVLSRHPGSQDGVWRGAPPAQGGADTDGSAHPSHDTYPLVPTGPGTVHVAGP